MQKDTSAHDDDVLKANAGVVLPKSARVTPMLRQWLEAKAKAKDAILLFRMGDFYELFADDAQRAAPVLDLAVTTRDRDKGEDAMPMAGFPHPQAPVYIAKLIAAGLKVAVCDQLEDPALARGIVRRGVTRVVTPGMVLEDESLDARANNYLCAVSVHGTPPAYGVAFLDVSTGELRVTHVADVVTLVDEVARMAPREIILEDDAAAADVDLALQRTPAFAATRVERRAPVEGRAHNGALGPLDPWLLAPANKAALRAAELGLAYAVETGQGRLLGHIQPGVPYSAAGQLLLDPITRAHLDLTGPPGDLRKDGTLLAILDVTKTAGGGRRLLRLLQGPECDPRAIEARLDQVEGLVTDAGLCARLRELLTALPDFPRLAARANAGRTNPRELARLRDGLARLPELKDAAAGQLALASLAPALVAPHELLTALTRALVAEPALTLGGGGIVRPGYSAEFDEVNALAALGRGEIAGLEESERARTGISTLKVRYTSVFGFYIEVTRAQLGKVPAGYRRKQTVANAERFVTDDLDALALKVEGAEARRTACEQQVIEELTAEVVRASAAILRIAQAVAEVDMIAALAHVASAERWTRPRLLAMEERALRVTEGRHPMVERANARRREPYVPADLALDSAERQILVVTGPNMAGKSTLMRQVALIQVLAQMGAFVPARSAELSLCDRIFTRIGASDDLAQGRSTFMVEMTETSQILRAATPSSLVLLDEIGRGTSTYDGLSLAWAVAEHLHDVVGARTLFATHYHELTKLADTLPRLKNIHVVVKEWNGEIVFLRALAEGPAARSYGIEVARLAGLPSGVLTRARAVLATLEQGNAEKRPAQAPAPQMSLFVQQPVDADAVALKARLAQVDVLKLTPLDAMNTLAQLVDAARK